MTAHFGKRTLIKFVGGQMVARQTGETTASMIADFREIKRRSNDMSPAFDRFVKVWFNQNKAIFAAQGIPRWKPLSTEYAAWKRQHFPGKRILRRSDALWASLTRKTRGTIVRVGPRSLQLGSSLAQSRYNQETRPHVVVMADTFAALHRLTLDHMLDPLRTRKR